MFILKTITTTLIVFITIIVFLAVLTSAGPSGEELYDDITNDVAAEAERQYRAVKDHGSQVDTCVRAGQVAEAYLQAGNDARFSEWIAIREEECRKAGMPTY